MRSPSPRASSISVEVDLIVTTRFGALSKVTSVPQLSTVTGPAAADGASGDGVAAPVAGPAAQPARSASPASGRRERERGTARKREEVTGKLQRSRSHAGQRIETCRLTARTDAPDQSGPGGRSPAYSRARRPRGDGEGLDAAREDGCEQQQAGN